MDFSFFLSYYRDNGLRLFNVQYKGRRILYEVCWSLQSETIILLSYILTAHGQLGLQEALALYAYVVLQSEMTV